MGNWIGNAIECGFRVEFAVTSRYSGLPEGKGDALGIHQFKTNQTMSLGTVSVWHQRCNSTQVHVSQFQGYVHFIDSSSMLLSMTQEQNILLGRTLDEGRSNGTRLKPENMIQQKQQKQVKPAFNQRPY